ncbi:replication initiator protein A [Gemmiger sp. An194]|uniref:replication initiator protein A n=1 Tax=Gemmiger sp. An194 TaxID=1965582 RepID=UPI000B54EBA4|nr:replication initiator protein A [Gemmiger sp. An194]OUP24037.1 hypothetical protein B5F28_08215 [Gemmiger sp. An194]
MFDYFYGIQSEQFAFYRIPKVLFTDDRFRVLSAEAKTLYGILLDRVTLSAKNGWIDQQGRVYIIYTIEEIMADMNCGNKKAIQLLSDLEKKVGLIERKRQGLGKPNLIYVKNFISVESHGEGHFQNCQKHTSGNAKSTSPEMAEGHGRNTDTSNTENSDIDSFSSDRTVGERNEAMRMFAQYQDYFRESLEMDTLAQDSSLDQEALSVMVDLIEPFVDPVFANNVILTRTERLMMSNRPKNPANARNKNVLIVGGSGSGKTRFWIKPNLLQLHSSYVLTDPKGYT